MNSRQVHLDFHTSEKIPGIGEKFSKEQFQEALKCGHVNSITVFSKCHHGWAYHPSKANKMHPNLKFDLLKAEIDAAHEIGVKTPVYLSVGFDEKLSRVHPDWLVKENKESETVKEKFSRPGWHRFCFNTGYLDYMLEQIKEVCENYDADGIFLDIVGAVPCYCDKCIADMMKKGIDITDDDQVMEFAENVYINYTKRVRETIDSVKPGLPVFHNGGHIRRGRRDLAHANSHLELESLPTGGWGYDHFPLSARYVQNLGMDYLGMTGKFHSTWGEFGGFKHPNALRYEVSLSAANGAKCSIGDQMHPSGEMDMATYKLIGAAYSELETKEEWLYGVESVADVGILSYEAYCEKNKKFTPELRNAKPDIGAARMMLEGKYLFDVLDYECDFSKYKVIVLPDFIEVSDELKEKLDVFVKNGGKILATGKSGLRDRKFVYDFGCEYIDENDNRPSYMRPDFLMEGLWETGYVMYSQGELVRLSGGKEHAKCEKSYFNRTAEHFCSHFHTPDSNEYAGCGISEGKDGMYIAWQVFSEYAEKGSLVLERMVAHALDTLLGDDKTIQTNLPAQGITTLMKQGDRYINHLLYASPVKRGENVEIIEDILPVHDTTVTLKLDKDVSHIYLAPQKKNIAFAKHGNSITFTIPEFECHQMIVIE